MPSCTIKSDQHDSGACGSEDCDLLKSSHVSKSPNLRLGPSSPALGDRVHQHQAAQLIPADDISLGYSLNHCIVPSRSILLVDHDIRRGALPTATLLLAPCEPLLNGSHQPIYEQGNASLLYVVNKTYFNDDDRARW